jgi:hypothetical protein
MFENDTDINLLAVAMAKNIADGCDKAEIAKILHLLALLQSALRTYII